MKIKEFRWYNPQQLYFGEDAVEELATLPLPGKKAIIMVTPERFYVERVQGLLRKNGVESIVYDEVRPNPNYQTIDAAAALAKKEGCDFVLSIGGGSATDSAKGVATVMGGGGSAFDYMFKPGEEEKPILKAAPIVVVSTTSGTGTEADQSAVVSSDELQLKTHIASDLLYPAITIVDPLLQVSIPPEITASTGMDVVFHAFEIYFNKTSNPYSDMFCLNSLKYAQKYLVRAYKDGNDVEARAGMALASNMAGIAMAHVDIVSLHSIAHTVAGFHPTIPHGMAISLFAIEWMKQHYIKVAPERFSVLSELVGYGKEPEGFIAFISDLLRDLDFDKIDISRFGIDPKRSREYAEHNIENLELYNQFDLQPLTVDVCESIIEKSLTRSIG